MKTLEHLKPLAVNSYNGVSFSPEKRGESIINDYSQELDEDIAKIKAQGANDEQIIRYKGNYENKLRGWLYSHSAIVSPMIAGPSNFPSERMRKRARWADNHYHNFREWRQKVLNAYDRFEKKAKIEAAGGELQIAKNNLAKCEKWAVQMVEANKIVRSCLKAKLTVSECVAKLAGIGMPENEARAILRPDFAGRLGYATYQLTNNNANIKRLKQRISELETKEQNKAQGNKEISFDGGCIILNYEIDRIQIKHDCKPDSAKISEMKHSGWKWSPFYTAWQRKLTNDAIYSAQRITNIQILNS